MKLLTLIMLALICKDAFSSMREKSYTQQNVQNSIDAIGFISVSKERAKEELRQHNVFFKDEEALEMFSEENLNSILAAIRLLPKDFQFIFPRLIVGSHNNAMERGMYEFRHRDGDVYNYISLTNKWSKSETFRQIGTVVHELGHLFGTILANVQASDLWRNSQCRWNVDLGIIWQSECLSHHVSTYSTTNPREDWAESFTTYILVPQELSDIAPKKYDIITGILTADPESFEISAILKIVPSKKIKLIKNESIMYEACLRNFGKKLKKDCLAFAMHEHSDLLKIFFENLGPQATPQFFSSFFKKLNLDSRF